MVYIGIDPGANGGIATIVPKEYTICKPNMITFPKPNDKNIAIVEKYKDEYLIQLCKNLVINTPDSVISNKDIVAYVEEVHSHPRQGVASTFTFGVNYGKILGILKAFGIEPKLVRPGEWKKELGVLLPKEQKINDANANKKLAKQLSINKVKKLYPEVNLIPKRGKKEHDGMAEALLIAEYGRRQNAE